MVVTEFEPAEADRLLTDTILTDEGRQDPYPVYATLRERSPRWRAQQGGVVLTRYADCHEALRNPRLGRPESDMELPPGIGGRARQVPDQQRSMLALNPPDHTRIRALVSRAFTPRRVEELRPVIESLLDPILERFADQQQGDVMSELAMPFPVAVISELLGVPGEGNEHIRPMVRDVTAFIDAASDDEAIERATLAAMELVGYFSELIEEKRAHPDDRLLSALIEVEEAGDRLSPAELIINTLLLYAAGFETTSNLIGNGLWALLDNPDQLDRLRADRDLLPSAMWEILRYDSPVQLNSRTALTDVELFGATWQRGDTFTVLQGCANRDAGAYPDPERFDVGRFAEEVPPPLSFGWGAHHCLGAHLARAEGEIVFGALLDRFASIELDAVELDDARPHYRSSFTLRGLDTLPVRVTAS